MGLSLGQAIAERRAAHLHDPIVAHRIHLVARREMILIDDGRYLGMYHTGVVRLVEVIGPELPVRVELDAQPADANRFVELVGFVELGDGRKVVEQRRRRVVHRVPHQSRPGIDAHFDQVQLPDRVTLRIVVLIGAGFEHAVEPPLPAVIRAEEAVLTAVAPDEPGGTVPAGVVKAFERSVLLPHDQHRLVHEIVHDVVAGLLQLLCTSC